MTSPSFSSRTRPFSAGAVRGLVLIAALVFGPEIFGQIDTPANIDSSLRRVLVAESQGKSVAPKTRSKSAHKRRPLALRDNERRVLVNIRLNGQASLADVRQRLVAAGANVTSENSSYRNGIISAFVPVSKVAEVARSTGVLSMSVARRPIKNVGATTSDGALLIHTDVLNNQGLDGTGETIGVLSDSYDMATTDLNGDPLTIHAAEDIASGDLPGPGNPNNPNPVVVIEDFTPGPDDFPGNDEGRAMLQILHDEAPKAKLAFATAFVSLVDF